MDETLDEEEYDRLTHQVRTALSDAGKALYILGKTERGYWPLMNLLDQLESQLSHLEAERARKQHRPAKF